MSGQDLGLYNKFTVERTDGQSQTGRKHDGCEYFVLDLTHDPFAARSLLMYALSCAETHPQLARDLFAKIREIERRDIQRKIESELDNNKTGPGVL